MLIRDPLPTDPLGQRLCQTFGYKWKTLQAGENVQWTTNKYPMRSRSLWARWQDAATMIGVRFGNQTRYALIDIDACGDYHTPQGLNRIQEALEPIGLVRTVPIRSSWSGGWHLYIPLPEAVSTFSLACTLKHALEAQGVTVQPGHCEVFPNIKPYGRAWEVTEYNGHRLPLQPGSGSCLLDHNLAPTAGGLERFFWQWDFVAQAQDMALLHPALSQGRELQRKRKRKVTGKVAQWSEDLRREIETGWTGKGQTNGLLKAIACYGRVFEGLGDDELSIYIEQMAITRDGYGDYCRHQHQITKKSHAWARWATRFYWPLGAEPKREPVVLNLNEAKQQDAKQRIAQAVSCLAKAGELATGVANRLKQLCTAAKTSAQTLYKNLELWHPDHWCVTPDGTHVPARSDPSESSLAKSLKSSLSGALHTLGGELRCVPLTLSPKNIHPPGKEGVLGGERGSPQAEGRC